MEKFMIKTNIVVTETKKFFLFSNATDHTTSLKSNAKGNGCRLLDTSFLNKCVGYLYFFYRKPYLGR